jgi:hypothetical protein
VAIPARLEQDVDDLAVLVDGPPEVLALPANGHEEFVEMPRIADRLGSVPKPPRIGSTERLAPEPDGLVRHSDTALGEQVFDVAETEREPVVQPDGMTDDRGREPVPWIAHGIVGHPATVPATPQVDNANWSYDASSRRTALPGVIAFRDPS